MGRPKKTKTATEIIAWDGNIASLPACDAEIKTTAAGTKYVSIRKPAEPRYYLVKQDGGSHCLMQIFKKPSGTHRRGVRVLTSKDRAFLKMLKEDKQLLVLDR